MSDFIDLNNNARSSREMQTQRVLHLTQLPPRRAAALSYAI